MSSLLFRIFIKNHADTANENVRRQYGILGGGVGIVLNLILFAFKMLAGILSASVSMIADALNNLSDAGSSVISLVGFKMSGKPADKDHPFGHGRIEYVSALLVSILILLMGIELIQSSVDKIIAHSASQFNLLSIFILGAAILVKFWMFLFNRSIGKKINPRQVLQQQRIRFPMPPQPQSCCSVPFLPKSPASPLMATWAFWCRSLFSMRAIRPSRMRFLPCSASRRRRKWWTKLKILLCHTRA